LQKAGFRRILSSTLPLVWFGLMSIVRFSLFWPLGTPQSRLSRQGAVMALPPRRDEDDHGPGVAIITRTKPVVRKPPLYRVLLLNDDFTPMEFVVHILQHFFNKSFDDAQRIMMHVHQNGVGECGVFTYEVAETKVTLVMDFARKHQHPLQCVMERN
jgi:ATP-dependent Clp protease adaptor protein ClpS